MSLLAPGVRLNDRFTLRQCIGAGGMSQVWRADDHLLGRPVAVKVLASALATDPRLREATWQEARAVARLTHPNVTQVYDYGEASLPGGVVAPYLVMEYIDGQSLAERLRGGPLAWPEAVRMGAQVAAALAAAHRLGVVHRDIKPGNVMLTATGEAKVLDFGIAALTGSPSEARGVPLVGTPAYSAPEQLQPGPPEPASDVYALGALLYEALTGRLPVAVSSWGEASAAHSAGVPVPALDVPGVPRRARRLCLACLSRDPAERPTVAEVAAGLAAVAGQNRVAPAIPPVTATAPVGATQPPTLLESAPAGPVAEPDTAPARRWPSPLVIGLGGAVVALGLVLAVVAAAVLSDDRGSTALPPFPSATVTTTSGASPSPSPSSASPTASGSTTATTAQEIMDELDRTITEAHAAGRMTADAAQQLRDRLDVLRGSLGRGKVRKQLQDLQRTINDLAGSGSVDRQTADQLTALLARLANVV